MPRIECPRTASTLRANGYQEIELSSEVILIRHAETTSNAAGVWQGRTNSGFSAVGREQAKRVAARLSNRPFDVIVSSDLGRAQATAGAIGDYETDPGWREVDLGELDGLTREEARRRFPEVFSALAAGEDVAFGGGERASEFAARLQRAFGRMTDRLSDGQRGLVITHGGAIWTLTSSVLGSNGILPLTMPGNATLTTMLIENGDPQLLLGYGDDAHLGTRGHGRPEGDAEVVLFRHAETLANLDRRWQGRSQGELTQRGVQQAQVMAQTAPQVDALYSSSLGRAKETARPLAEQRGYDLVTSDEFAEIDFGQWEDLTAEEAEARDPEHFDRIYRGDEDLARGIDGESFSAAGIRMKAAIDELAVRHRGGTVGVVTHGGSARAFILGVLGLGFEDRHRLHTLGNAAFARVAYRRSRPLVAQYNVASLATP